MHMLINLVNVSALNIHFVQWHIPFSVWDIGLLDAIWNRRIVHCFDLLAQFGVDGTIRFIRSKKYRGLWKKGRPIISTTKHQSINIMLMLMLTTVKYPVANKLTSRIAL